MSGYKMRLSDLERSWLDDYLLPAGQVCLTAKKFGVSSRKLRQLMNTKAGREYVAGKRLSAESEIQNPSLAVASLARKLIPKVAWKVDNYDTLTSREKEKVPSEVLQLVKIFPPEQSGVRPGDLGVLDRASVRRIILECSGPCPAVDVSVPGHASPVDDSPEEWVDDGDDGDDGFFGLSEEEHAAVTDSLLLPV